MFASAGSVLKFHVLSDGHPAETVSIYKPKKPFGPPPKITNVSWCHDNTYIALLQEDCQPQIVSCKDRANVNLVHTVQSLKHVSALSFKRHTKRILALGDREGEVALYDTKNRNAVRRIGGLLSPVRILEFNNRDEQMFVAGDNTASLFSDHDGVNNFVKEVDFPETYSTAKFHPISPNILAVGNCAGQVQIRDTEKGEVISTSQRHSARITGVAFTSNHKIMVTTGMDNKICVHDCNTTDCAFKMNIHQAITSSDVSPDDVYIAAGLDDGCIYIYDIRAPLKPVICTNAHECAVNKITFESCAVFSDMLREKTSATTLNESEFGGEIRSELSQSMGDAEKRDSSEEKFKRDVLKMVKNHMTYLESQLTEHCAKFQNFIGNEFDAIHNAMARWDVFNVGDTSEIVEAIDSTDTKSLKSTSTQKSKCQLKQ